MTLTFKRGAVSVPALTQHVSLTLKMWGCPCGWRMPVTSPWVALLKPLSPFPWGVWVHGVNMEMATRGLQGAVNRPSRRGRFTGGFSSQPWVLQNSPKKVRPKRGLFCYWCTRLCSKDRMYQPVLKTRVGPRQSFSPRDLCLQKLAQKIPIAKK